MSWGGQMHDITHRAAEPAHTHPHRELKTLFLVSFKRIPEDFCSAIKPSWQIYNIELQMFSSTLMRLHILFEQSSQHQWIRLSLSDLVQWYLTPWVGLIAHTGFYCCLTPTEALPIFSSEFLFLWDRLKKKTPTSVTNYEPHVHTSINNNKKLDVEVMWDEIYWCNEHAAASQELFNMSTTSWLLTR